MIPPLGNPANTLLLRWLEPVGVPVPALLHDWEADLYRVLAAPDLVDRMLALAGASRYWALYGFPALIGDDGQVDVLAAGLSTLVVRCTEVLPDLAQTDARPPVGWVALDAWAVLAGRPADQVEARLAEVLRAARLR